MKMGLGIFLVRGAPLIICTLFISLSAYSLRVAALPTSTRSGSKIKSEINMVAANTVLIYGSEPLTQSVSTNPGQIVRLEQSFYCQSNVGECGTSMTRSVANSSALPSGVNVLFDRNTVPFNFACTTEKESFPCFNYQSLSFTVEIPQNFSAQTFPIVIGFTTETGLVRIQVAGLTDGQIAVPS
jgi:hypothetical protein